jgi:hypothetical protein
MAPTVIFELTPIATLEEVGAISPRQPLPNSNLIPMGRVIEGFHGTYTSNAFDAADLHEGLYSFVKNRIGDGENGIIGRDDGILCEITRLVGCSSFGRNVDYYSTPNDTRPDFVGRWCNVQVVFCEEKDDNIQDAVADLWRKFRFVDNYSTEIKYMFTFAISRDNFQIIKFRRNGMKQLPLDGEVWFESTLNSIPDRMKCIIASMNVGRILKFYVQSNLITPSPTPSGT